MLKRIAEIALIAVLPVVFLASCVGTPSTSSSTSSSSTSTSTTAAKTPTGSLITLISDTPGVCDAVSLPFNVIDLALIGASANGQTNVGTVPINSGLVNPPIIHVDLACLRDFATPLIIGPAKPGTYTTGYVTLAESQVFLYDPTILPPNPPINIPTYSLTPIKNIQVPIEPPLVVINNAVSMLKVDFDMIHMIQSITTDPATGKTVVTGSPEITLSPITSSGSSGQGFGMLYDVIGFVRSVTPPPPVSTSLYDGSFTLQTLSASITGAPLITVNLTSSTLLYGFSALNQLNTDSVMEVDGYFDVDGNFVATSVEDEYVEIVPTTGRVAQLALIGPVTSLTRDGNGNVTTFNQWVRDVEPNAAVVVLRNTMVTVNTQSATTYQYSSRSANFANLPFGPANINVGQEIVVHGFVNEPTASSGTGAPALPTLVTAYKIYDKLQSIQGTFSALVQAAADGKTGAFSFTPCGALFQSTPALVLTNGQTNFVNLTGLSALNGPATSSNLLVQGLPFYEQQAQTINGVAVPAGTLVILARQVHQLP